MSRADQNFSFNPWYFPRSESRLGVIWGRSSSREPFEFGCIRLVGIEGTAGTLIDGFVGSQRGEQAVPVPNRPASVARTRRDR